METSTYTDELITTLTRRLHELELQAAAMGMSTPPHVNVEIQDIRERVQVLSQSAHPIISAEMIARMEPGERWKRLYDAIWELEVMVYSQQKNGDAARLDIQKRFMDINKLIQRCVFEIEIAKRERRRLYMLVGIYAAAVVVTVFIIMLTWYIVVKGGIYA